MVVILTVIAIVFVIVIFVIAATSGNKKSSTENKMTEDKSNIREPNSVVLKYVFEIFEEKWNVFMQSYTNTIKQPQDFHRIVALALDNLTSKEKAHVISSILYAGVEAESNNGSSIYISYKQDYLSIYKPTINLIESGNFSEASMTELFKILAQKEKLEKGESVDSVQNDKSLIDITGMSEIIDTIQETDKYTLPSYQYEGLDHWDSVRYRMGNSYKEKLKLSKRETKWLNRFWYSNVFLKTESNRESTIIRFLEIMKDLDNRLVCKGSNIEKEIEFFREEIVKVLKENNYSYSESFEWSAQQDYIELEIYETIFRRTENAVRKVVGHGRKVSNYFKCNFKTVIIEFENRIGNDVNEIINHAPHSNITSNIDIKQSEQENKNDVFYWELENYRFGNQYKDKLSLTDEEVSWLNNINYTNVFLGIEGCKIATIIHFCSVIKNYQTFLKNKSSTLDGIVNIYYKNLLDNHCYNLYNYKSLIFEAIFRRVENSVRLSYGHLRQISGDYQSYQKIQRIFENTIGNEINQIIFNLQSSIPFPNEETEIEINAQNIHRWKIGFENLTKSFTETAKQDFLDGIYKLEKVNCKNPNIEIIFFEASKFIAEFDKIESLKFYIYYLYYDLKSKKIDNKQLSKTIQKSLFKTNEQLQDFSIIVADLVKTKDLNDALAKVIKIYTPKRKKIQLDATAIKDVQKQDQDTVELLNEYLEEEYEDGETSVKAQEINKDEIRLDITSSDKGQAQSKYISGISLNQNQSDAISFFVEKTFSISIFDFDSFCKTKGAFRNQLIDSINEICFEVLDDVLIEEDGEAINMNEIYYKKIIKP